MWEVLPASDPGGSPVASACSGDVQYQTPPALSKRPSLHRSGSGGSNANIDVTTTNTTDMIAHVTSHPVPVTSVAAFSLECDAHTHDRVHLLASGDANGAVLLHHMFSAEKLASLSLVVGGVDAVGYLVGESCVDDVVTWRRGFAESAGCHTRGCQQYPRDWQHTCRWQ